MTPEQLDKLRRIDAHLANLLSTAEKRTPGEWSHRKTNYAIHGFDGGFICKTEYGDKDAATRRQENAAFIASCAGNAEAGWKATRAAIHTLLSFNFMGENALMNSILSAFPNV